MNHISAGLSQFAQLRLEPYSPLIGAIVTGVDLSNVADERLRDELRRALARFQVLVFRNQKITPQQHLVLARVFGDPEKAKAFFPRLDGAQSVELIETGFITPNYGNDQWHADITFCSNPPTGTALYARKIPSLGGDTVWASATRAFELLPEGLQHFLSTLEATHSFEHSGWPAFFEKAENGAARYAKARADFPPVVHPVIRTHPVTGEKILYVNPEFTDRIKGLSRQMSDSLLGMLFRLFEKPEIQIRVRWEVDTLVIWDNCATVHYAVSDYAEERHLHRVTFGEDAAF